MTKIIGYKEYVANHCQVGNVKLALDTIMDWLVQTNRKNKELEVAI